VNQQDIGYKESLILFVKDLRPTAQTIAEQKLLGLSTKASKYHMVYKFNVLANEQVVWNIVCASARSNP
jgi:hypothetical protein